MSGRVTLVGLGPGSWEQTGSDVKAIVLDPNRRVVVRTLAHPAAAHLAEVRSVEAADFLYEEADTFEQVYERLADMVVEAAVSGNDVVLALPGSALVGERTTGLVRHKCVGAGVELVVVPGRSFLDSVFSSLGLDPLERGLQVLDGRDLPDPLELHLPTVIAQVDLPVVLADLAGRLARVLPEGSPVVLLHGLEGPEPRMETVTVEELATAETGPETTVFIEGTPVGWAGLVQTMRRLRRACPWDRRQTHESLVGHVIEEAFELVDAIAALDREGASAAYLEEELGDVLLQVLFQTIIAEEEGRFGIEDVTEALRAKLVRRHPHVFGDAVIETADQVYAQWTEIKESEKPRQPSVMEGLPGAIPALQRADAVQRRAARVGFDWEDPQQVMDKVIEEVGEVRRAGDRQEIEAELGDLLFAVVNLARHFDIDPEVALLRAGRRFEERFRELEATIDVPSASLVDMDRAWEALKGRDVGPAGPGVIASREKEGL